MATGIREGVELMCGMAQNRGFGVDAVEITYVGDRDTRLLLEGRMDVRSPISPFVILRRSYIGVGKLVIEESAAVTFKQDSLQKRIEEYRAKNDTVALTPEAVGTPTLLPYSICVVYSRPAARHITAVPHEEDFHYMERIGRVTSRYPAFDGIQLQDAFQKMLDLLEGRTQLSL